MSSPSRDLFPTADEQVQVNASADYFSLLASGIGQPAEQSMTQVGTPGKTCSTSDPCLGDRLANMMLPDTGRESRPAFPAREGTRGYFTASKLRLPLPSSSSPWAVETNIWSHLWSVFALA